MIQLVLATAFLLSHGGDSVRTIPVAPVSRVLAPLRIAALDQSLPQPILGPDKLQHFAMTYAITAFTYAAARSADVGPGDAVAAAAVTAAVAGIGKELLDHRRGGPFSMSDLVADALGGLAAYTLMKQVR
ncbi:MAG: hypothetical protein ABIS27_08570 [Longimicrobiales bacterium]